MHIKPPQKLKHLDFIDFPVVASIKAVQHNAKDTDRCPFCVGCGNEVCASRHPEEGNEKSHRPPTKKNSIVDTISAMEFCFICSKCLIFALLPLISVILRAIFNLSTINPPTSAPWGQK